MLFNNYGTVDLQSGTLLCNDSFLNNGTVSLRAGATAQLAGGGSASGTFTAAATALVEWTAGTFTLNSGAQLNDAGIYQINGATLTCNPDVVVQNLEVLAGALGGSSTVTVSNVMNWTGGTMSGSGRTVIAPGATLNINSPSVVFLANRTLEIGGTAIWTDAGSLTLTAAVITNRAGRCSRRKTPVPLPRLLRAAAASTTPVLFANCPARGRPPLAAGSLEQLRHGGPPVRHAALQ